MDELLQKSFGSYKRYKVTKDRVLITTKNINKYEEYYIKLDNLGLDLTRKQTKSILLLIPIYLAFTGLELYVLIDEYQKGVRFPQLLFWIGGVILFGIGAVYSFFQKTDKVFIQGGTRTLELNGANPNKETVDEFIRHLQNAIRQFYKNRYAIIDPNLDEETQILNYKWLKEVDAITEAEFEDLIQDFKIKKLLS